MSDQALRFRIGAFVAASAIVFLILAWLFTDLPRMLVRTNKYTVVLPNGSGIVPGTQVRRSGIRIGQVRKVELDDATGQVNVEIEVGTKYTIRQNEVPLLTRNVFGDPALDFVPIQANGKAPTSGPIEPGTQITGSTQTDIPASAAEMYKAVNSFNRVVVPFEEAVREFRDMARATKDAVPDFRRTSVETKIAIENWGRVGERVETMMKTGLEDKVLRTLDSTNSTVTRMGDVLNDANQKNFAAALKNIRDASDNFDSLSKNADEMMRETRLTLRRLDETFKQTDLLLRQMDRTIRPLADRSESLTQNLDESAVKLNKLLTDMNEIVRAFGQNDGTLQRLMSDPGLYNNMNTIACQAVRLMPRLERVMKDIEVFADKVARHPEALGVGGAVRPGSGLK